MGMGGIIDFLFLASGAYLVGTALMAKRKGNVVESVMLGKNMSEKDIEDKSGFLDYMCKRLLISGVMIVAASLVHLANDYYIGSNALTWVGIVILLIALVIYVISYQNGQKLYMKGWVEKRNKEKEKERKNK